MVTADKAQQVVDGIMTTNTTFYGLSTDQKPTHCGNGSVYIAMDTGAAYFFDAANATWREM